MIVADTKVFVSLFLSYGGIANQNKCIDDRLSFKRARHRQTKKNKLHTTEMLTSCNASEGDRSDSHWCQP